MTHRDVSTVVRRRAARAADMAAGGPGRTPPELPPEAGCAGGPRGRMGEDGAGTIAGNIAGFPDRPEHNIVRKRRIRLTAPLPTFENV